MSSYSPAADVQRYLACVGTDATPAKSEQGIPLALLIE